MSRVKYYLISFLVLCLSACAPQQRGENDIIIGTIAGPETKLMEEAQRVAKNDHDLNLKIITFEDYIMPNTALAEGAIDANMFQHQAYLDVILEKKKYPLVAIGKMYIYPMGVYSKKVKSVSELRDGAIIGIPNDPSNGARALRLLAEAKLITVPDMNDLSLNPGKITDNPKKLVFKEIAAAQLPRVLNELDAAVINTNYAIPAGLHPTRDAIVVENKDSPYANIVVVRESEKDQEKYQKLMKALHSQQVQKVAEELFEGQAIPAW